MIQQTKMNLCAIYCRLSVEDDTNNISQSIQNQKEFLRDYCINKGFSIYDVYIDDGYSGTDFNRPAFTQMIEDIKRGKINIVVTKDLSRLGRNYIKTGYYTDEFFPEHNVRYIAVNDNVDTYNENDNDFAPFKNVINEMYAKDISKKIRYTLTNIMKKGIQSKTSIPIYGYDFNQNGERIIDENAANIVKYIFKSFLETNSENKIAEDLKHKLIPIPGYYYYQKSGKYAYKYEKYKGNERYNWQRQMVYKILTKQEYLGTYIRGKSKSTFKNKKQKFTNNEERFIHENIFQPIIDEKTFYDVQRIIKTNASKNRGTHENLFRGITYCKACNAKLKLCKSNNKYILSCRNHKTKKCGMIQYEYLKRIIINELQMIKSIILNKKEFFLNYAKKYTNLKPKGNNLIIERLNDLKIEYEANINKIDNLFNEYNNENMNREIYLSLVERYTKANEIIKKDIEKLEKAKKTEETKDYYDEARQITNELEIEDFNNLNEISLKRIINRIDVECDEEIIKYKKKNAHIMITYAKCDEVLKEFIENVTCCGTLS